MKDQTWWDLLDQAIHESFDSRLVFYGDQHTFRVRHDTATDEEWEEEKKEQKGFRIQFFTRVMNIEVPEWTRMPDDPDEGEEVELEFARIFSLDTDSGESCIVESSPTAVAALLITGW